MAITAQLDGFGRATVTDDTEGLMALLDLTPTGVTITEISTGRILVADDATAITIPFGGVGTAKFIAIRNRTAQEIDINLTGGSTPVVRIEEFFVWMNADGLYTAATIDNDLEGTSECTVDYLIAG